MEVFKDKSEWFTEGVRAYKASEISEELSQMLSYGEIRTGNSAVISVVKKLKDLFDSKERNSNVERQIETCLGAIIHLVANKEQAELCIRDTSILSIIRSEVC